MPIVFGGFFFFPEMKDLQNAGAVVNAGKKLAEQDRIEMTRNITFAFSPF